MDNAVSITDFAEIEKTIMVIHSALVNAKIIGLSAQTQDVSILADYSGLDVSEVKRILEKKNVKRAIDSLTDKRKSFYYERN